MDLWLPLLLYFAYDFSMYMEIRLLGALVNLPMFLQSCLVLRYVVFIITLDALVAHH